MLTFLRNVSAAALIVAAAAFAAPAAQAETWDIAKAAAPYKGTQLNVDLSRPPRLSRHREVLPEFEKATGIKVNYEVVP